MRESKQDLVISIFRRDKIVTVCDLERELLIKEPMVRRYIGKINALSSVNCNSKYYILPDSHTFEDSGIIDINGKVFYKGGTLQAALYHIVDHSSCGLQSGEIKAVLKTPVNALLPQMAASKKIARTKISGVRGFVYTSLNTVKRKSQIKARKDSLKKENKAPISTDADTVIDILVTMVKSPKLSIKDIAESLTRRGRKVSSETVNDIIVQFGINKKNF